jgi:hypothetical protein
MSITPRPSDSLTQRANALYWESDRSVNQIAGEMDLSKGMLYGMIHPLPAELPCPRCSTGLEYANRTARDRGLLSCPACGLEAGGVEVRDRWELAAAASPGGALVVTPIESPPHPARGIEPTPLRRDPFKVGAGLLLVAAGIWLFRGLGRR